MNDDPSEPALGPRPPRRKTASDGARVYSFPCPSSHAPALKARGETRRSGPPLPPRRSHRSRARGPPGSGSGWPISVRRALQPPSGPVEAREPYDFSPRAFLQRIGASAFCYGGAKPADLRPCAAHIRIVLPSRRPPRRRSCPGPHCAAASSRREQWRRIAAAPHPWADQGPKIRRRPQRTAMPLRALGHGPLFPIPIGAAIRLRSPAPRSSGLGPRAPCSCLSLGVRLGRSSPCPPIKNWGRPSPNLCAAACVTRVVRRSFLNMSPAISSGGWVLRLDRLVRKCLAINSPPLQVMLDAAAPDAPPPTVALAAAWGVCGGENHPWSPGRRGLLSVSFSRCRFFAARLPARGLAPPVPL